MRIYDPLYSGRASGKHAGGIFSHSRGLQTFKKFTMAHQPNTTAQRILKTQFSTLQKYWSKNLTYEQIVAWNEWTLPWTNSYGQSVILTGINKFFIVNRTLLKIGKTLRLTPPDLTPTELIITDDSAPNQILFRVTQLSAEEVAAQHPFLFIELAGEGTGSEDSAEMFLIVAEGIPQSTKPLNKQYKFIGTYTDTDEIANENGMVILDLHPIPNLPRLISIRVTRYNEQGMWTNPCVMTNIRSEN